MAWKMFHSDRLLFSINTQKTLDPVRQESTGLSLFCSLKPRLQILSHEHQQVIIIEHVKEQ